jgi:hypothetical protein
MAIAEAGGFSPATGLGQTPATAPRAGVFADSAEATGAFGGRAAPGGGCGAVWRAGYTLAEPARLGAQ